MAALRRARVPEKERHLTLLICDEAKHVFNNQTERILTECVDRRGIVDRLGLGSAFNN